MHMERADTHVKLWHGDVEASPHKIARLAHLVRFATNRETDAEIQAGGLAGEKGWGLKLWTGSIVITGGRETDGMLPEVIQHEGPLGSERLMIEFHVPRKYLGVRNLALVLEPGHYAVDGHALKASAIYVVEDYPKREGWYVADPLTGVPHGMEVDSMVPGARFLSRAGYWHAPAGINFIGRMSCQESVRNIVYVGTYWDEALQVAVIPDISGPGKKDAIKMLARI